MENLAWFPGKCFPFILSGKHFPEVVKNLVMSYYLLIILNLILKLLIVIYILFWIFIFQLHPLEFNFYINFGPYFYNCYLIFSYYFLIEIFYLSNLILICLIVTYFIWNNLWNVIYYYFNFFIFQFFLFFRWSLLFWLLFILFEIIYEIIFFFQFHSHSTFQFVRFVSYYFNKLEKNKTLISYFLTHFPWHSQTLESVFQLIFHYTTKHRKIIHFLGIHFPKKNYFTASKRGLRKKM
jgi:hypothetical protein